jgi:hypothetical protein
MLHGVVAETDGRFATQAVWVTFAVVPAAHVWQPAEPEPGAMASFGQVVQACDELAEKEPGAHDWQPVDPGPGANVELVPEAKKPGSHMTHSSYPAVGA